ncbi:hypothetical protein ROJ8625_00208 [Roseivivax jejudonensis]|uniref:Uncharacterized protein n=1 Tax=Roseivivax jejudonensis TaxID=1529041 RepID=A0A1X6Y4I2_9RHOB|nr:hypothetical protein [Roseivivax jejudonensis]SLN10386.1 hypothetical protein ROJ8625_00208 [Roseivivax jejudonensis]
MIRHLPATTLTLLAGACIFYVSRFWTLRLWSGGLFGIEALPAQGGLTARWLRGTPLAPYELIIWLVGGVLMLTVLEALISRLWPPVPEDDSHEG